MLKLSLFSVWKSPTTGSIGSQQIKMQHAFPKQTLSTHIKGRAQTRGTHSSHLPRPVNLVSLLPNFGTVTSDELEVCNRDITDKTGRLLYQLGSYSITSLQVDGGRLELDQYPCCPKLSTQPISVPSSRLATSVCRAWFLPVGFRRRLFCTTMATELAISTKFGCCCEQESPCELRLPDTERPAVWQCCI